MTTVTMDTDRLAGAREQGQAQFDGIAEMVANLRIATDDDAFEDAAEDLARKAGYAVREVESGWRWFKGATDDPARVEGTIESDEEAAWLACCEANDLRPDEDDAHRAIDEDPLSVEVRSGWTALGDKMEAEEFCILLCTGGPACRILGDLDEHGAPTRAYMQVQDWFTVWTDFFPKGEDVDDTLLTYAQQFYFGD